MGRRATRAGIVVITCTLGGALAGGCGWSPTASHTETRIVGVDLEGARAEVAFRVQNPWPVRLPVEGLRWELGVGGVPVASGEGAVPVVPARGEVEVVVPVVVRWEDARAASAALDGAEDEVPWSVGGEVVVATPMGVRSLPVGFDGSVPVLRLPTVAVDDLRLGASADGLAVAVDLRLVRAGGLSWRVDDLRWSLVVDEAPLARGAARATVVDEHTTVLTLATVLHPSAGLAGARRLWAGDEVVAAWVLDAALTTPLGVVPLATRVERSLRWE